MTADPFLANIVRQLTELRDVSLAHAKQTMHPGFSDISSGKSIAFAEALELLTTPRPRP